MGQHSVQGYQYITFGWVMLWVTFLCVLIRLYFRVFLYGNFFSIRTWRWAEIFVIIGWLLALGCNICNSIGNDVNANNISVEMTTEQTVIMLKAYWAWAFFYKPSIYAMKAALLCFYTELINKERHRNLWISIVIVGVLNAMGCASQILYIAFQCIPFELNWNPEPWSDFCRGPLPYQIVTLTGHVVTDLLVFVLPFFIVKYAMDKLTSTQKKGAFIMFGLGFINLAIAIVLFVTRMIALGPNNIPVGVINVSIDLMYNLQLATAIAIPCIPQMRLFYKKVVSQFKRGGAGEATDSSNQAIDIGPTRKYSISQSWSKTWGSRKGSMSKSGSRPSVAEGAFPDTYWYKYWKPGASFSKPVPNAATENRTDNDSDTEKSNFHSEPARSPRPENGRWSKYMWRSRSASTSAPGESPSKTEVNNDVV